MAIEKLIRERDVRPIPVGPTPCLIAREGQYRSSRRIEGEEHSQLAPPRRAGAKLLHVLVSGCFDRVRDRAPEVRTVLLEEFDCGDDLG